MHEGRSVTWREIAEKHHAAFIDEMQASIDASIRAAVTGAVEEVRRDAQKVLAEFQADSERRFDAALSQAHNAANLDLARQRDEAERNRQVELGTLHAEAQAALSDVKSAFESSRDTDRDQARKQAQQSLSEHWNQILRRLRQCETASIVLQVLVDATAPYASRAAVLSFERDMVRVGARRNVALAPEEFRVDQAPAILSVIETRDPIVAIAVENEISPVLVQMLQPANGEKTYLFPIRGRQAVVAVLVAQGEVNAGAMEFFGEAAGMQLIAIESGYRQEFATPANAPSEPAAKSPLVQLESHAPVPQSAPAVQERKGWDQLDAAEQKLHLQAQRFARVQIAEMRLYQPEAVRQGNADKNLYQLLKPEIDEARNQFLHRFLSISPSMVDYLHLEILRSLVHDDDRLLGLNYPGPMV